MAERDVCLFLLGVFDERPESRMKRTDAVIDVSPFPKQQLEIHNNALTCPRERRAYAGLWKLCVIIRVPTARRLDVTALKIFWRRRSRTLEKRIEFGVKLACALKLDVYTNSMSAQTSASDAQRQATVDRNTLVGPPLCRASETVCFTAGSPTANGLSSGVDQRVAAGPELASCAQPIDWERLAHLAITDPTAPLDATSQLVQLNNVELMLHAASRADREAAQAVVSRARADASAPLARADIGSAPFEHLRENLNALCSDASGALIDNLLSARGDECYVDMAEFCTRNLERVRLHRTSRCVCGAVGTVTRRVRVAVEPDREPRRSLACTACNRVVLSTILMAPDICCLRRLASGEVAAADDETVLYKKRRVG